MRYKWDCTVQSIYFTTGCPAFIYTSSLSRAQLDVKKTLSPETCLKLVKIVISFLCCWRNQNTFSVRNGEESINQNKASPPLNTRIAKLEDSALRLVLKSTTTHLVRNGFHSDHWKSIPPRPPTTPIPTRKDPPSAAAKPNHRGRWKIWEVERGG